MKREEVEKQLKACLSDFDPRWLDEGYPGNWEYAPPDRDWWVSVFTGPGPSWEVNFQHTGWEGDSLEEALANFRRQLIQYLTETGGLPVE